MRSLGIDYGLVRTGLAISDELGMIASPLETVETHRVIIRIGEVIREKSVQILIVGMPRNMDGSYGPQSEIVKAFIEKLKSHFTIPIRTLDERLTTKGVERALIAADVSRKKRKEVIDKLAAQQILQGYLDSQALLPPSSLD